MEIATMMAFGYALTNLTNLAAQGIVKPLVDKMTSKSRQQKIFDQIEYKSRLDKDVLRLNKQLEFDYAIKIQELSHRGRLSEAKQQFNDAIKIQEYSHHARLIEANQQFNNQALLWRQGQFNDNMWPLKTPFGSQFLNLPNDPKSPVPINVFLAKTEPKSPYSQLFQDEVKRSLSDFLQNWYQDRNHPVVSRIGDWKEGFQDDAFINALWYGLKGQPTVVVNPIQTALGNDLSLNVSFWGLGGLSQYGGSPKTQRALTCQYNRTIGSMLREETLRWQNSGLNFQSPSFNKNLQLLQEENALLTRGKTQEELAPMLPLYKFAEEITPNVIKRFSSDFAAQLAIIVGTYCDVYHLLEYGTPPRLPQAIRDYNKQNGDNLVLPSSVCDHYQKTLTSMACSNYFRDKLSTIYLGVAREIKDNRKKAEELLREGVGLWANRKTNVNEPYVELPKTLDDCVRTIRDWSDARDEDFLGDVYEVLHALGADSEIETIREIQLSAPTKSDSFETEYLGLDNLSLDVVARFSKARNIDGVFAFAQWNENVWIGVPIDRNRNPVSEKGERSVRYFVFYKKNKRLNDQGCVNSIYAYDASLDITRNDAIKKVENNFIKNVFNEIGKVSPFRISQINR